jgi:hypothetical protein
MGSSFHLQGVPMTSNIIFGIAIFALAISVLYLVYKLIRATIETIRNIHLYLTVPEVRERVRARRARRAERQRKRQRAFAARTKFLKKHRRNTQSFDTNAMLIGSSAWLSANDLTSAFPTNDHFSFNDSLNNFDHNAFASNFSTDFRNSSFSIVDHVHGGTDSTGMGGMTGHNDQGWGTDSDSSISHSSFSSSSHDPFA